MIPVLVFLIISGLVTGGASVAAENSLPGDLLYPIKVGMNEKVGAALTASAEARADYDARIALRRVMEAEQLSIKGNISADVEAQLESNFKAHADSVAERVAQFEADGKFDAALEANSNFQSSLDAHDDILVRLAAEDKDASDRKELSNFVARLKNTVSASGTASAKIESKIKLNASVNVQSAAEGKLGAAQNKVAEVRRFLDENQASVSVEVKANAEARLSEANSAIAQGKIKIEAKAYGEAFVLFQRAHRLAQEAQMTVNGNSEVDSEIRINLLNVNGDANTNDDSSAGANSSRESSTGKASGRVDGNAEATGNADAKSGNSGTNANGSLKVKVGL